MVKGTDIYIDTEYNTLFISVGEKMTDESIRKLKEGLHNNDNPYDGVYVMENINSVQYVSKQKSVKFNNDVAFKYMD